MEEKVKKLEEWQANQSSRCSAREIRAIQLETAMCEIQKDITEIKENQHEYMSDMNKFKDELFDKLDSKYAGKWVETEIRNYKDRNEQRNYDWVKYAIITGIMFLINILSRMWFPIDR